jgi:hypothetical protein
MTKKIKPSSGVKADATARAELVAKASYERKHTSTEVIPPDVTRAKAGAWLDIISPITEWAGLKGDALRYRRQQLRIQQEAALERLAHTIEQKMRGRRATTPLSPKVLVPALEAASLEDPESPLIAWWANLLVSGATGAKIRPYLIDLMGAIGPEEAECLSKMWKGISSNSDYLTAQFDLKLSAAFRAKESLQEELENFEEKSTGEEQFMGACLEMFTRLALSSEERGFPTAFTIFERSEAAHLGHRLSYSVSSPLLENRVPVEICLALRVLEEYKSDFELESETHKITIPPRFETKVGVAVVAPTKLGVEFLKACKSAVAGKQKHEPTGR